MNTSMATPSPSTRNLGEDRQEDETGTGTSDLPDIKQHGSNTAGSEIRPPVHPSILIFSVLSLLDS